MVHARALLTSTPAGRTTYLEADLRSPEQILAHPELRKTLDLREPVALMLVTVLHFIEGYGAGGPIVRTLLDALPRPGRHHGRLGERVARPVEARLGGGAVGRLAETGAEAVPVREGLDDLDLGPALGPRPHLPAVGIRAGAGHVDEGHRGVERGELVRGWSSPGPASPGWTGS